MLGADVARPSSFLVVLALAAAASAAACRSTDGGAAGPRLAAAAAVPSTESPPRPRRAPLRFEVRGRPFPLPLVSGTISGHPTLMILDTGASSHVLAAWFARKFHVPMRRLGEVGTDHVGTPITAYRVDKPEIALDEWGALPAMAASATEVPDVFEKLGIGAFISPQHLVEEGSAVELDLARGELRSAAWAAAYAELTRTGTALIEPDAATLCVDDGPVKGLAYVVPADVEHQPVRLLVDTGSQLSDIFATSEAGKKLFERSDGAAEPLYTASGKVTGRHLRGAHLTAGSFAVTTNVNLVAGAADSSCPRDGVLGMDVLRSCTLLFGRPRLYARCTSVPN